MYYSFYCFLIFTTVLVGSKSEPSFMDAVPLVSQGKTLFLYVIGKEDQARQTIANFKNVTHLWESVKDIDNSLPIYGQIKGFIVGITGDKEQAKTIIEAAQKSTSIAGGFMLAGPVGGVAGSVFADSVMSLADLKPKGTIDHIVHLKNKTASENIDLLLDLGLAGVGTEIKKPTISTGAQQICFEMKKTGVHPLKGDKYSGSFSSGKEIELADKVAVDRKSSVAVSLAKEGGEAAKIFIQPYTPYGSPSPSQNNKENHERKQ